MPYWEPYNNWLNEDLADINNAPAKPFAGSIIAAEFLKRFVKKTNTLFTLTSTRGILDRIDSLPREGPRKELELYLVF